MLNTILAIIAATTPLIVFVVGLMVHRVHKLVNAQYGELLRRIAVMSWHTSMANPSNPALRREADRNYGDALAHGIDIHDGQDGLSRASLKEPATTPIPKTDERKPE